ncbi:MAG: hypothetical protein JNL52_06805 [Flavobacteriales bacterium]|nr:hypothetical protein [Flavobacteriales bacterium]
MRAIVAIAFTITLAAQGQNAFVSADTLVLRIGERANITLGIDLSGAATKVNWPALNDTLAPHLEVIRRGAMDTLRSENGTIARINQRLEITSFDTGFWAVPPFTFTVDGRNLETAPLLFEIRGVAVDEGGRPRDLSPLFEPPFDLGYWLRQHWMWITAGIALLGLIIAMIIQFRKPRKPKASTPAPVAQRPVHERFLELLDRIEKEQLWQAGDHKAHQSQVTDAVRGYIEERYDIPALERTTDELLQAIRVTTLSPEQQQLLANMLRAADLVKFAKAVPSPSENEQLLRSARDFIRATITHG